MTQSLQRLREMMEKATPGWWAYCSEPADDGTPYTWIGANAVGFSPVVAKMNDVNATANGKANGRLIVAMHSALPALLDCAEALRVAQLILAQLARPEAGESIQHVWAHCVEAELIARKALEALSNLEKAK